MKGMERVDQFPNNGSGWRMSAILGMNVEIDVFKPMRGSTWIDLPKKIKATKGVLNVQNNDNRCFMYVVLSGIHPLSKNGGRASLYKRFLGELNFDGIEFPVKIKDIGKFEKQNNIRVNVFGYDAGSVYPIRLSGDDNAIDLLLISDEKTFHYCWIKNFYRLISSQVSKNEHKKFICKRCIIAFEFESALDNHKKWCTAKEMVATQMPKEGTKLRFKNKNRSMRVLFVIYADFEAVTTKIESEIEEDSEKSYTKKYQNQKPSGYCLYVKGSNIDYGPFIYRGEDAAKSFVNKVEDLAKLIYEKHLTPIKPLKMTKEDWVRFRENNCHICEEEIGYQRVCSQGKPVHKSCCFDEDSGYYLIDKDTSKVDWREFYSTKDCHVCIKPVSDGKVKYHDHITGKFRGPAHNSCNINFKVLKFIPVIFHNLEGYDSHMFIRELGETEGDIGCIAKNEEKYISFTKTIRKVQLRFIDSFKFMSSSLDSISKNLKEFKILSKSFDGEKLNLLKRKGVYPYDYMDSFEKFEETSLTPIEKFYSTLYLKWISEDDYNHAKKVWEVFGMKNMGEYHDLYLKTDVLLLADVFENFRDVCMKNYKLDPAWYYAAPVLSWDALLKSTDVELDLLSDVDMLLFFERSIRGGVSMISHRYAEANNKYMKDYDNKKPSKYLMYLDANNLYGHAMLRFLPTGGFKWMTLKELENIDFDSLDEGYMLEVDLEYPQNLHDLHNGYPLAPEKIVVNGVEKLIPTL